MKRNYSEEFPERKRIRLTPSTPLCELVAFRPTHHAPDNPPLDFKRNFRVSIEAKATLPQMQTAALKGSGLDNWHQWTAYKIDGLSLLDSINPDKILQSLKQDRICVQALTDSAFTVRNKFCDQFNNANDDANDNANDNANDDANIHIVILPKGAFRSDLRYLLA
ncbi:hypothetical protein VKT23_010602 [Stygiomarasmius scandens]|uniref:Uncharacterized protein n=1 Tax=Marasmiellus scandens TaxID=2682957 RepID=A0ABR1JBJ9_9AGAR